MQGKLHIVVLSVLTLILCSGCASWFSQKSGDNESQKEEKKTLPPLHLGAVHQVYPAQKFAVLRIIGPIPSPGTTLISHPADGSTSRIGNLMVSENSSPRNGMLIADIRSGSVVSGDRVFLYRNIAPPDESDLEKARSPKSNSAQATLPKPPPLQIRTTSPTQTESHPKTAPDEDDPVVESPPLPEELPDSNPPASTTPDGSPAEPTAPSSTTPHKRPDYIDEIPDDINGWN